MLCCFVLLHAIACNELPLTICNCRVSVPATVLYYAMLRMHHCCLWQEWHHAVAHVLVLVLSPVQSVVTLYQCMLTDTP